MEDKIQSESGLAILNKIKEITKPYYDSIEVSDMSEVNVTFCVIPAGVVAKPTYKGVFCEENLSLVTEESVKIREGQENVPIEKLRVE